MNIKKYVDYIVISIVLLFHSILNIWYVFKDTLPPSWDQAYHLLFSSAYFHGFDLRTTSNFYPPGAHISAVPLYALFGESYEVACSVNIIFLGILMFSLYGIGKELFNREIGLLSAIFISFIPLLIMLERDFFQDFPLLSIVSLSVFLLLKTNNFNNTLYCGLFAVSVGFATLIKWSAPIFIFIPFCWIFYKAVKEPKVCTYCGKLIKTSKNVIKGFYHFCSERHKKKFVDERKFILTKGHNYIISFVVFITTIGWWYLPNYNIFGKLMGGQKYWGTIEGKPEVFSFASFFYYIEAVIEHQAYLVIGTLLLVGLLFLLIKCEKENKLLIGLSILFPYLFFTLIMNKTSRYTIPIFIFLVLCMAFMIASINNKKLKSILVLGIILFGVVQTSTITFGYPKFDVPIYIYPAPNQPNQEDWRVNEVLDIIQSNSETNNPNVLIVYNHAFMNWRTLQYYNFLNQKSTNIYGYEFINVYPQEILNLDFVLYVKEDREVVTEQESQIMRANRIFEDCISEFMVVDSVVLPNKRELYIYKKK